MSQSESLVDIMSRIEVSIVKGSIEEHKAEDRKYLTYCFELRSLFSGREYKWNIKRTYYEYQNLYLSLLKELHVSDLGITKLPPLIHFRKASLQDQIEKVQNYLKHLIANYQNARKLTEFIEVSYNSFNYIYKFKEGYAYKIGSGRLSNQRKYCNFYQCFQGNHLKWLRVTEKGIEYSDNHYIPVVGEVIEYAQNFKVTKGRYPTGFKDGVKVTTSTHNITFRVGNTRERDELEHAILEGYSKSVYFNKDIRYESSFVERQGNFCKWYVDAQGYFGDVMDALQNAKKSVCITDWWMSPELYLKRPSVENPSSQVVEVLGSLADRGVKVYVHLYKEISFSLALNSLHTKNALLKRSNKINVLRHPNISIKGGVFLWSHHEKLVAIDGVLAFMGGLDLCYGRYDDNRHLLVDVQEPYLWNNIDYSNVRVADFTDVENYEQQSINRNDTPRMPWHDIAMSVRGPVVEDIERHFRELWNHAVRDITGSRDTNVILPPSKVLPIDTYKKNTRSIWENRPASDEFEEEIKEETLTPTLGPNWEHNQRHSGSIFEEEARPFIDVGELQEELKLELNQVEQIDEAIHKKSEEGKSLASQQTHGFDSSKIFTKMIEKELRPHPHAAPQKLSSVNIDKALKEKQQLDTQDNLQTQNLLREAMKRGMTVFLEDKVVNHSQDVRGTCQCQLLRSAGLWSIGRQDTEHSVQSAYIAQIAEANHFIYIENQFFISGTAGKPVHNLIAKTIVKRIKHAYLQNTSFKVIVVIPLLPGFEGDVDDPGASVLRVQLHHQYRTICRGTSSIYEQLRRIGMNPKDYIRFYGLRTHAKLGETPVTEMIYVHSKLMIIDDRTVIMGSANINDRSMIGSRDSELAMITQDTDTFISKMAGEKFEVSKFAHSLRMSVFREHSGETRDENLIDPFGKKFFEVWENRAKVNTKFYRKVFRTYPDDRIASSNDLEDAQRKINLESYDRLREQCVGHLVQYPLKFLRKDNLQLKIANREYFLPEITFT